MTSYTITKKIAKAGENAILVIPKVLRDELAPHTLVKVTMEILKRPEEDHE